MRLVLLSLAVAACGGTAQPGAALPDAPDAATSGRAVSEAAPVASPSVDRAPTASPASEPALAGASTPPALRGDDVVTPPATVTPEPTMRVVTTAVRLGSGEIALDLQSDGWPGRGESPALVIGDRRFEDSEHTHPTVLRFVVPADAPFVAGAPAAVAYGDDTVARFELPEVSR